MRSKYSRHKQKKGDIPKHCPACLSSRLEIMLRKVEEKGEIIELKGYFCLVCGFSNCRRLTNKNTNEVEK